MNRQPPELLYCIADLLEPSETIPWDRRHIYPRDDLLSLIKTCRLFYQVLIRGYYRALIKKLGLANCFQRASLKDSASAMELIRDIAGDSFPMPNDQMYIWLETSLRFRGGYEPFCWLLATQKEMQINVIKVKKSRLLYTALRSTNERILRHLFDEADEEDIHKIDEWTGETLLMASVRRRQSKDIIRYLLQRGIEITEKPPGVRKTALDIAIEVNWLYAIEVFIEYDRKMVNQLLWEGLAYMPLLKGMFEIQSNPDVAFDDDYIFRFAEMIFDHGPDEYHTAVWGREVLTRAMAGRRWGLAQNVIQHGMGIDFSAPNNCSMVTTVIQSIEPDEPDEYDGVITLKMLLDRGATLFFSFRHIDVDSLLLYTSSAPVMKLLINHHHQLSRVLGNHSATFRQD